MSEEKIIVVQDDKPTRKTKWSLRRYLTETWHYKWWVLGLTVLMTAVGALGLEFVYNRPRRVVSGSFSLGIPNAKVLEGGQNGPTFVLYGGSTLASSDMFSISAIEAVIGENQEFNGLNAEKISDFLSFSVAGSTTGGVFTATIPYTFNVHVNSSAFASFEQAKNFIVKIAERPLTIGKQSVSSYSLVPMVYDGFANLDYSDQVSLLSEKSSAIYDAYASLLAEFSGSHLLSDGRTTLSSEVERFRFAHVSGSSTDVDAALGELSSNNYLKFVNTAEGRTAKIAELKSLGTSYIDNTKKAIAEITTLVESYNRLASTTQIVTTDTSYTETMVKLNNEISAKQKKLNEYLSSLKRIGFVCGGSKDILEVSSISEANSIRLGATLSEAGGYIQHLEDPDTNGWADACVSFGTRVNSLKALYDSDVTTVNGAFRFLQSNYASFVRFSSSSIVVETGGINFWLGAIAGLVLGFAVSSLVCTFVGIWKEDKETEKTAKVSKVK